MEKKNREYMNPLKRMYCFSLYRFWIKRENGVREPDNWDKEHVDGEDCASLGHPAGETDFWTDAYCFQKKRFICEAAAAV